MSDKLAFPEWKMGQVLLPEQFLALQEALLAQLHRRVEVATGLPAHGLARMSWGQSAKSLYINRLTWVFESGLMLDVPGNATVTDLDLADVGKGVKADPSRVSLFLHVCKSSLTGRDRPLYDDDGPGLERVLYEAKLSLEDKVDDARESGKLAELVRTNDGWMLGRYAPPLLRVGTGISPFLLEELEDARRVLERLADDLTERRNDAFRGSNQVSALPQALAAVYRVLALLADHGLRGGRRAATLHPYRLFSALRDVYVEIAMLEGSSLAPWPIEYEHGGLAPCFEALRLRIERHVKNSRLLAPRLELERREHLFVTPTFPAELGQARRVYLVIRPGAASLDGVKLASPRRIGEVVMRSLTGVRLSSSESETLSYDFGYGRDVAFYELRTQDDAAEWGHVVSEAALCFQARPGLEDVRAALVWRA